MTKTKARRERERQARYNYNFVPDGTPRFYTVFSKTPHYGAIGCAYDINMFHKAAACYCGSPGKNCKCIVDTPPIPDLPYPRKSKKWMDNIKPMLLFTIRHRKNSDFVYSFFSKDLRDAQDEIVRLNKGKWTTDNGFYLDESGFDEEWNKVAVNTYRDIIAYRAENNISEDEGNSNKNYKPKRYMKNERRR